MVEKERHNMLLEKERDAMVMENYLMRDASVRKYASHLTPPPPVAQGSVAAAGEVARLSDWQQSSAVERMRALEQEAEADAAKIEALSRHLESATCLSEEWWGQVADDTAAAGVEQASVGGSASRAPGQRGWSGLRKTVTANPLPDETSSPSGSTASGRQPGWRSLRTTVPDGDGTFDYGDLVRPG